MPLAVALSLAAVASVACSERPEATQGDVVTPVLEAPSRSAPVSMVAVGDAGREAASPTTAPDVVFRTLSGERLALREAAGPTLVAFWSTTCTVCLQELPELDQVHADYAARGFALVAVAMPHDRPDTVLELVTARGWQFPVALDIDGAVLAAFEPVPGTPTHFLIDADGTVIERRVGATDIDALRATLDRLLRDGQQDDARLGREPLPPRSRG